MSEARNHASEHWAANSADPVAVRARGIILANYGGVPPWRTEIDHSEWQDALRRARRETASEPMLTSDPAGGEGAMSTPGAVDFLTHIEAEIDAILRGRRAGWDQALGKLRAELREAINAKQ